MSDKHTLELYSDATIAQIGTDSERRALREQLNWQIGSWGSVYGESRIEGLWYKLGKINLGDAKVRAEITEFMTAERKSKGGIVAGSDFERRYEIIMRNIAAANELSAAASAGRASIAATTADQADGVRSQLPTPVPVVAPVPVASPSNASSRPAEGLDIRTRYNERMIAGFERPLAEAVALLDKGDAQQKALLVLLRAAMKDKSGAAVKALQAEIQKMKSGARVSRKGDPDGYFGPLTLKALQGIVGIGSEEGAGAARTDAAREGAPRPERARESGSRPTDPTPVRPGTSPRAQDPAAPENSTESYAEDLKKLESQLWAWRAAAKGADMLSDGKDRESNSQLLDAAMKALAASMMEFNAKYVAGKSSGHASQVAEYLKSINNEIALYLRGEGKTTNKHYRDPVSAEAILKGMLGTKLQAPEFPSRNDLMKSLDGNTKTLILAMIEAKTKQGKTFEAALGEALGNPTIKGAWNKVYESGFSKYEKDMVAAIGKVDAKKLTPQEKSGLDQLKDMYGTTGWLDFKDRNKAMMEVGRNQLFAVGLGIAGAALTTTGVGVAWGGPMMVAAASALVGGTLMTGTAMALEGKVYSGKEFLQEEAVNVGTFGVGGFIFKYVRIAEAAWKIGMKAAIGVEMAGDLSLGMSVDQVRSKFQGVDVSLAESLKTNLPWALLPLVFRGKSVFSKERVALAQNTQSWLAQADTLRALGDTNGANATVARVNDDIAAVRAAEPAVNASPVVPPAGPAAAVKATPGTPPAAVKATPGTPPSAAAQVPEGTPAGRLSEGSSPETTSPATQAPRTGTATSESTPSSRPADAPTEPAPGTAAPQRTTAAPAEAVPPVAAASGEAVTFRKFVANFESNLKKLKEGGSIELGDTTITLKDGQYHIKVSGKETESYLNNSAGINNLKKYVNENIAPDQMVKSSLTKHFNDTVAGMAQKEFYVGGKTYMVSKDGDKFVLKIKNATGGFVDVSDAQLKALTPADANTLMDSILGKGASGIFDKIFTNPLTPGNPMFDKVKDIKVKDYFDSKALGKIPKFLWENTIGGLIGQLKHSLHLPGIRKLEVFRTMFTGRSSEGNLIFHGHGGHSSWVPGSAWTPSLGTLATVGLITAGEVYQNDKDNIHGTEDMINQLYNHKGEFANNYFEFTYLGWLGTLILEAPEFLGMTKDGLWVAASVVWSALGRVRDGEPDPHYLAR